MAQIQLGKKYGRLTVTSDKPEPDPQRPWNKYVHVRCTCGVKKLVLMYGLLNGGIQSCGCLLSKHRVLRHKKHGQGSKAGQSPEYKVWLGMKSRCHNPKDASYENYGGRGIQVCVRWQRNFADFYADMGPRPSPKHSIDRISNDGHYEPTNCRWATNKQQSVNKRVNRYVTIDGVTKTISEWAEETGLCKFLIRDRLNRGWTGARLLTPPASRP